MTIKVMMIAPVSAVPPEAFWLATVMTHEPAEIVTTVTVVFPPFEPPAIASNTISSAKIVLLVNVKLAAVSAAREAVLVVIWPESEFKVTPVVRFVA